MHDAMMIRVTRKTESLLGRGDGGLHGDVLEGESGC
jgi:hypothetical protein